MTSSRATGAPHGAAPASADLDAPVVTHDHHLGSVPVRRTGRPTIPSAADENGDIS